MTTHKIIAIDRKRRWAGWDGFICALGAGFFVNLALGDIKSWWGAAILLGISAFDYYLKSAVYLAQELKEQP